MTTDRPGQDRMDGDRPGRVLAGLREFYGSTASKGDGSQVALALFHDVAATVPAYAALLAERGVDPAGVATAADFARAVPVLDKAGYHQRYPLARLCRHGRLDACDMVAVSTGSSGTPTVWPRSVLDERAVAARFEQVFRGSFQAHRRTTLAVVCFALGTWVGGMYTAAACRHLAAKGYPITVATPGNNLDEIMRVVTGLGGCFDQVVLLGYPPFVKNVIDAGPAHGVDWARLRIRLVLAGEVFSENWRDLVGQRAGQPEPGYDSASLYGTADAGVLGTETPLSVAIRRFLAATPAAAVELFGGPRLPTLVQYDPATRFFEAHDGRLVFTADGGVPLIRYRIGDEGGIAGHAEVLELCARFGFHPDTADPDAAPELPFVWVFGRSLFAISYFGANVYPENVADGLERPEFADRVTGKFVLRIDHDADEEPRLVVVVESAPGAVPGPGDRRALAAAVAASVRRLNSEFANYVPPAYQTPQVELRAAGDPEYFPPGVKHRYVRP